MTASHDVELRDRRQLVKPSSSGMDAKLDVSMWRGAKG